MKERRLSLKVRTEKCLKLRGVKYCCRMRTKYLLFRVVVNTFHFSCENISRLFPFISVLYSRQSGTMKQSLVLNSPHRIGKEHLVDCCILCQLITSSSMQISCWDSVCSQQQLSPLILPPAVAEQEVKWSWGEGEGRWDLQGRQNFTFTFLGFFCLFVCFLVGSEN